MVSGLVTPGGYLDTAGCDAIYLAAPFHALQPSSSSPLFHPRDQCDPLEKLPEHREIKYPLFDPFLLFIAPYNLTHFIRIEKQLSRSNLV